MGDRDLADNVGALLGRCLIGAVYIVSGVGLVASFQDVAAMMAGRGIPLPMPALCVAIAVWFAGGTCVILGWWSRLAASALFVVSIQVVVAIHWPWHAGAGILPDELNHFMQGLAMLGGLLYLAVFGPGAFHIERLRRRARLHPREAQ